MTEVTKNANSDEKVSNFEDLIFSLFSTISAHSVTSEKHFQKIYEGNIKEKLSEFIHEVNLSILYSQLYLPDPPPIDRGLKDTPPMDYQVSSANNCQFSIFTTIDQIKPNNILLCIFMKKNPHQNIQNILDDLNIQIFHGRLSDDKFFILLNSTKPLIENFFLHSAKNQTFLGDIMRTYSDYELTLFQLQTIQNFESISCTVHPIVEKFVDLHPDWEQRVSEFHSSRVNDNVLKEIYNYLLVWLTEIQRLLQLDIDLYASDSCLVEMAFWKNKDLSVKKIIETFKSPYVLFSIKLLEDSSYRNLSEKITEILISDKFTFINRIFTFLNTLKLNDIINAKSIDELCSNTKSILYVIERHHVNNYPDDRIFGLCALLSRDLNRTILRIFPQLEQLSFDDFLYNGSVFKILSLHADFIAFITSLKTSLRHLASQLRDKIKRYQDIFSETIKLTVDKLKDLSGLFESFQFCEEFFDILQQWLSANAYKEFPIQITDIIQTMPNLKTEWFTFLKSLDLLDFTKNGLYLWNQKISQYHSKLKSRDSSFVDALNLLLNDASSDDEKIDIFVHFTYIFKKFRIIKSIHGIQNLLVDKIYQYMMNEKENIFKSSSISIKNLKKIYSFGDFSLHLMNIRKMTEKYKQYLFYTFCILGPNYKMMDIAKKIILESNDWSRKNLALNILNSLADKNQTIKRERLLLFRPCEDIEKGSLISVNFPNELIKLSLDEIYAKSLGYTPTSFYWVESNVEKFRCFRIIDEALRNLNRVKKVFQTKREAVLICLYIEMSHRKIVEGLSCQWDSTHLQRFAREFSECIVILHEKSDIVEDISSNLESFSTKLQNVDYKYEIFQDTLQSMKKELALVENYQLFNIEYYMNLINKEVEDVLFYRLETSLNDVLEIMSTQPYERENIEIDNLFGKSTLYRMKCIKSINFDVRFQNDEVYVTPTLDILRNLLYAQMNQEHLLHDISVQTCYKLTNYKHLLHRLITKNYLSQIYGGIEKIIVDVTHFVKYWGSFKMLWEAEIDQVTQKLDSIDKWLDFYNSLLSLKHIRTSKCFRIFPFVVVRYKHIKSHISRIYNRWIDTIFSSVSKNLNSQNDAICNQIQAGKANMKHFKIDTDLPLTEIVKSIGEFEAWRSEIEQIKNSVETLNQLKTLLDNNKIIYESTGLSATLEFEELCSDYEKCRISLDSSVEIVKIKLIEESQQLVNSINFTLNEWCTYKSELDQISATCDLEQIKDFEVKIKNSLSCIRNFSNAKKYLNIPETVDESYNLPFQLESALDELSDIRLSREFVQSISNRIASIGQETLGSINSTALNSSFVEIEREMSKNTSFKAYDCFVKLRHQIQNIIKANEMINSFRVDIFKDRHWRFLFSKFDVNYYPATVTLSQLWALNLTENLGIYNEVFAVAQGEFGLENYLKTIEDHWTRAHFALIPFKNKYEIVNNWADILTKLGDHINGMESMKASPYFKEFAISANQWLDKLTFLLNLSETWIEVQRKWIYLSGIFMESSDISKLLASESSKFISCTNEFSSIVHKISKDPSVFSVFKLRGIIDNLKQLLEYFINIQKALSKYLETEREHFPRFYFVGDEDLLEILGNSNDLDRIQNHLKKMFPGISKIILSDEKTTILGICSKEEEVIMLENAIIFSEHKNIISWLKKLEKTVSLELSKLLKSALAELRSRGKDNFSVPWYFEWIEKYPQQLIIVCEKIVWCNLIEDTLSLDSDQSKFSGLENIHADLQAKLQCLTILIKKNSKKLTNLKMINLITNLVYMRNKTRHISRDKVTSVNNFDWLSTLRYYYSEKNFQESQETCCVIKISDCEFFYGFEYLGVIDYIIQTPLIDNCFLVLTQAMNMKLGGSPFGPAGTGKTESVKALGAHMGRMVIVFNCDSNFDFQSMGRIFIGLCRVGAWGCFDEFNRLEERIISAVSQQIHSIQTGLRSTTDQSQKSAELLGRSVMLNNNVAIFITMNPGYAGRSRLPNNLKQLFRSFAMTQPDGELIGQVILYSQGFTTAESLASKIVPLLKLCKEQLSQQYHYDFGLRTLKYILVTAGGMIRRISIPESEIMIKEQEMIIQSVLKSIMPKLTADDTMLFLSIIDDIFPSVSVQKAEYAKLISSIQAVCEEMSLEYASGGHNSEWLEKILYLSEILNVNHGIIMVGESSTGKTSCWKVLLEALHRHEKVECQSYMIDPKAITKESLYGSLDPITRIWNDGVFTAIIRNIIENCTDFNERHWIVFDGDIDPEWVENLNSTLDDNKLFTLPNGERLFLPPNVRIIFEVSTLKFATLATISRCGMIYFSDTTVSPSMQLNYYLQLLLNFNLDTDSSDNPFNDCFSSKSKIEKSEEVANLPIRVVKIIENTLGDAVLLKIVEFCRKISHCMEFSVVRALQSFCMLISNKLRELFMNKSIEFDDERFDNFAMNLIIYALIWGFVGDSGLADRLQFCEFLESNFKWFGAARQVMDCHLSYESGLLEWKTLIRPTFIPQDQLMHNNFIVSTEETVLYSCLITCAIDENRSIILCGPPGSGKTMLIENIAKSMHSWEIMTFNFSSTTTSEDFLRHLNQKCEYKKGPNNLYLCPKNKNLIVFCDEVNMAHMDSYGTQNAICLLRQLLEIKGFYQKDRVFVKLERIKFVAACCPPTFVGLNKLSPKFLRHNFVLYIDYPKSESLHHIYSNLNSFMDSITFSLCKPATESMIEFYQYIKDKFTTEKCAHYTYTPRDLTLWVQGIIELTKNNPNIVQDEMIEAILYEGSCVFIDRLTSEKHKSSAFGKLSDIISSHFPSYSKISFQDYSKIYSDWLTGYYAPTESSELMSYCQNKFENNTSIAFCTIFDQLLVLSQFINRIVDRHQGHLILVGKDGSGRKSVIKLVSYILEIYVYKVRWHKYWTVSDFDEDLRDLMKRVITKNEKIFVVVDESSCLPSIFFERVISIISTGGISDLYQDEKYTSLISILKDAMSKLELEISKTEDLCKWFIHRIKSNIHFIFMFNDNLDDWQSKVSKYSHLFKKCTLKWLGDWSTLSFVQLTVQALSTTDFSFAEYEFNPEKYLCPEILTTPCLINSIVDCIVSIHLSFSQQLKFSYNQIPTAQKFLIFVDKFKTILANKLGQIEEEHSHISTGLIKLEQTFSEVAQLKADLSVKKGELEIKNNKASQKLSLMATEQQKAQATRTEAMKLFDQVKIQSEIITTKSKDIKQELAMVEPALEEAKDALSIIDRNMLNEIRVMFKPPALIKLAIESVYELITGQVPTDWKNVKTFLNKDDFIQTIRNFKTESITPERRAQMEKYLTHEKFTPENIARGSLACVPLVKWVRAHVGYNDILMKIDPLKNELSGLEKEKDAKEKQAIDLQNSINDLELKIEEYKEEYSVLIREIEEVKQTLVHIERKVEISSTLLTNLEVEQSRWAETHKTFQLKKNYLIGNCLLSAAFVVYFGNFDKKTRDVLWQTWIDILKRNQILFENNLFRVEYLSLPDERHEWTNNGLPNENLCFENATILKFSKNFSFIIDPSGQAASFLKNSYKNRKVIVTSFLNNSFKKEIESALRFGNILIINNTEFFDNILINVIEQDYKYLDNRRVVNIAGQEIDFSPSFGMFLITTDPNYVLPSTIFSKMTVINFTITFSGLESQCLHQIFKKERPDLEAKRVELTKMQGEYRLALYNLQKHLLKILNEAQGGLLDDDRIVSTLRQLNKQSIEINTKVKEADNHLVVVHESLKFYLPFASICSSIYFLLQDLCCVNHLYHYSLEFFLEIFNSVFQEVQPTTVNDEHHLEELNKALIRNVVQKVIFGLLQKDKQLFLLLLSRIYISQSTDAEIFVESLDFIFNNQSIVVPKDKMVDFNNFPAEINRSLNRLLKLKQFSNPEKISNMGNNLLSWSNDPKEKGSCPECWEQRDNINQNIFKALNSMLLMFCFSPINVFGLFDQYLECVLGEDTTKIYYSQLNMKIVVLNEVKASTPMILLSVPGFDPSTWIDDLVHELQMKNIVVIAMGSPESCIQAEKALVSCSKSGGWLVLKNIHLCCHWIRDLEKNIYDLKHHNDFRLFLTAEITSELPSSLIRLSRFLTFEPPPGVKPCMYRTFNIISKLRISKNPKERSKIYFLLAWIHAIIIERLSYSNIGWSKAYEFSESDLRVAFDMVDSWIDRISQGRSNLPPEKMPWDAMKSLLNSTIYGSYMENIYDSKILNTIVNEIFDAKSFESDYPLVKRNGIKSEIFVPESLQYEDYIEWIKNLPNKQSTSWLKLPANAEKILLKCQLDLLVSKYLKVIELSSATSFGQAESLDSAKSKKIQLCQNFAEYWLATLPTKTEEFKFSFDDPVSEPVYRFLEREFQSGKRLLEIIRSNLDQLVLYSHGKIKVNNDIDTIIQNIKLSKIPKHWLVYIIPPGLSLNSWLQDFASRLDHLKKIAQILSKQSECSLQMYAILVGKFFLPEAFTTAIRQSASRQFKIPLEQLTLEISISDVKSESEKIDKTKFTIGGLEIHGCRMIDSKLELSEDLYTDLPNFQIRWINSLAEQKQQSEKIKIPVYLDVSRKNMLFDLEFDMDPRQKNLFYQHGVAVFANQYNG
ncbi:Cytoplasmic dynein 1 heavy chain 1 [Thelohanellus kitauei]|uniref:Cytoplasmic dynein 1 heavy chain 1 n=1 Tax=Thelohanellus kitauei TaxID=669202 RepID=A0A0C2MJN0_THEKT|nr:Cytoplasmic dynein 1 heavy chain 1 [Thelohanellus kitauei]